MRWARNQALVDTIPDAIWARISQPELRLLRNHGMEPKYIHKRIGGNLIANRQVRRTRPRWSQGSSGRNDRRAHQSWLNSVS